MMTATLPTHYPVWWPTGAPFENGFYLAKVISAKPYTGKYPEHFTHVLLLEASRTKAGLEMSVNLNDPHYLAKF